jgi:hypothetical protein
VPSRAKNWIGGREGESRVARGEEGEGEKMFDAFNGPASPPLHCRPPQITIMIHNTTTTTTTILITMLIIIPL